MDKRSLVLFLSISMIVVWSCSKPEKITYPVTKKVDQIDDYFGTKVADPYRWLEDDKSAETAKWVEAQNSVTFDYLKKIPFREALRKHLTDIYNYPRYTSPLRAGEFYFFNKNDGLQNQSVLYYQHALEGKLVREIELPALGTANGFEGWKDDKVIFYAFTSFTFPPTIYKYQVADGKSEVFRKAEVKFNPDDYEVKQVFYESKDKTRVPIFIVHKKGLALDGKNPCYLTGYGGFNISMQPAFSPSLIALLEKGVVYAEPNLRGGGEYGETWHKAGMLQKKQNVFDDFIAAAEYLMSAGYTSKDKLSIGGGSTGGLKDGLYYKPQTGLAGIVEKQTGDGDFNAPQKQIDIIKAFLANRKSPYMDPGIKDVPVNFLSTVDTTGGNSGSPTLNAKGELVGLLFDGTYESVASNFLFDNVKTRSIHVDSRYMLWNMAEVDGALNLIKEMGIGKTTP